MGEHTATPWFFEDDVGIKGHVTIWGYVAGVKTFVADCYEGPDDAAFIVRAANAHDDLVAALRSVLTTSRGTSGRIIIERYQEEPLQALLAKAEAR